MEYASQDILASSTFVIWAPCPSDFPNHVLVYSIIVDNAPVVVPLAMYSGQCHGYFNSFHGTIYHLLLQQPPLVNKDHTKVLCGLSLVNVLGWKSNHSIKTVWSGLKCGDGVGQLVAINPIQKVAYFAQRSSSWYPNCLIFLRLFWY